MKSFITIEGGDGIGKTSVVDELEKKLNNMICHSAITISFPNKNGTTPSQRMISKFLNGSYGNVHPDFVSTLFSIERLERKDELNRKLEKTRWFEPRNGTSSFDFVLADRYTLSNIAYQKAYLSLLGNTEIDLLNFGKDVIYTEFDLFDIQIPNVIISLVADEEFIKNGQTIKERSKHLIDKNDNNIELQLEVNRFFNNEGPLSIGFWIDYINTTKNKHIKYHIIKVTEFSKKEKSFIRRPLQDIANSIYYKIWRLI
jgi:thymidylate kinase